VESVGQKLNVPFCLFCGCLTLVGFLVFSPPPFAQAKPSASHSVYTAGWIPFFASSYGRRPVYYFLLLCFESNITKERKRKERKDSKESNKNEKDVKKMRREMIWEPRFSNTRCQFLEGHLALFPCYDLLL